MFTPMKTSSPNPNEIMCKDCKHRDKTILEIGSKVRYIGVTRATCEKYIGMPEGNDKPYEVLFDNAACQYYEKE